MADLSDVTRVLGEAAQSALYPNGVPTNGVSPVVGLFVIIDLGWPEQQSLKADLTQGKVHVSVYPRPTERVTTRYLDGAEELSHEAPTYALGVSGQTIAVAGGPPSPYRPQNIAVRIDGVDHVMTATAGQTAAQLASSIAAAIGGTASGQTITVPAPHRVQAARVGTTGTTGEEVRRQEREFQITIWAPSPQARDAVSAPLDNALARISFLTMPDGYAARLSYRSSMITDFDQKQGVFRRDLFYTVEYATTDIEAATEVVAVASALTA